MFLFVFSLVIALTQVALATLAAVRGWHGERVSGERVSKGAEEWGSRKHLWAMRTAPRSRAPRSPLLAPRSSG